MRLKLKKLLVRPKTAKGRWLIYCLIGVLTVKIKVVWRRGSFACSGQEMTKAENAIKKLMALEFLNLPESHCLIEAELEEALTNLN